VRHGIHQRVLGFLANTMASIVCRATSNALVSVSLVLSSFAVSAQNAPPATASAQPAGWQRVQALSPASRVRIASDTRSASCFVVTVSDAELTCSRSKTANRHPLVFPRSEIKSIKFSRQGHSAAVGLLIGLGAGAGIGAGVGAAVNAGDKGGLLHVNSSGRPAAVGAVLGAVLLGGVGGAIGYATDLFAGPLVYRR
jgi:uncharacterized Zn-finger protein